MTDMKISDLTSAGTLNDVDVVPVVQSGDTKKVAVSVLKAAVAPSNATESTAGIIEIASQAEAESQTNDDKAMTALKVQQFIDVGVVCDGATGGNQGDGTINAKGLFVNGEAVGAGGGLELISSSTPTGVASVSFTSIPQTYRGLHLVWQSVSCDTATRSLIINVDFGAGVGSSNFHSKKIDGTTITSAYGNDLLLGVPTLTAAQTTSGNVLITPYQAYNGATGTGFNNSPRRFECSYNSSAGNYTEIWGGLYTDGASDVGLTRMDIYWSGSGNFDGGTFKLYGIL